MASLFWIKDKVPDRLGTPLKGIRTPTPTPETAPVRRAV